MNKVLALLFFIFLLFLSSCINYEQKTVLKNDGSGSMVITYSTKNFNIIGEEIFGFGFTDSKIRENFSSPDIVIKWIDVNKYELDSTTHVRVDINFKNFYTLPKAKAFRKVKPSFEVYPDSINFSFTILEDSSNAIIEGMDKFKLYFDFEFEGDVIETNGTVSGNVVRWEYSIADLSENIVMKAKINNKPSGCGLFGIELFGVLIFGIILKERKFQARMVSYFSNLSQLFKSKNM